ncbi:AraC family transcriptional regulator ligand-binding domain-containing protein [Pseudomonas berkeleyensis]|uniref:AraC family transcriptional regulator ligand-binding domain-containing protein n=1 Tax=Pseudomonas berkeleyensis TaxID=2726956 RepID=A0A7G5DSW6_9PSED|nr:AraC family transcriptional regulator [Pseudomonas berkeleyensis]QMV64841.1 AraC family transcriptional regulator ligand-binding domain-containing protein [Pseudomonas berkeleyensis]WSO40310.1 AraC family transcriptional regulator ligand-binding domain-containing protein [Pseudomonas berkeleyensis]
MQKTTSVSALTVLDLHDALLEMGVATLEQMTAAGLYRDQLIDQSSHALPAQEQRLDESLLLKLWQLAAANSSLPHIGLLIGQRFNPATRGVLASWLFQCTQVSEALDVFQKHIALMNPSESWIFSEADDSLLLQLSFAADKPYPQAAIERSLSAWLRWCEEMTGQTIRPQRAEFSFSRPEYHQAYVEVFGDTLVYDSPRNCLQLPRSVLDWPIRGASSYLKQIVEQRALQRFEQLQAKHELLARVRQLIQTDLQQGVSIEKVCRKLHVSRPTLYRRLKQEGTSFTQLVGDVRKQLAFQQIRQGLPVAQVSDDLGFKDVSTFHRAFKRWFNQSPGEYRGHQRGARKP